MEKDNHHNLHGIPVHMQCGLIPCTLKMTVVISFPLYCLTSSIYVFKTTESLPVITQNDFYIGTVNQSNDEQADDDSNEVL